MEKPYFPLFVILPPHQIKDNLCLKFIFSNQNLQHVWFKRLIIFFALSITNFFHHNNYSRFLLNHYLSNHFYYRVCIKIILIETLLFSLLLTLPPTLSHVKIFANFLSIFSLYTYLNFEFWFLPLSTYYKNKNFFLRTHNANKFIPVLFSDLFIF